MHHSDQAIELLAKQRSSELIAEAERLNNCTTPDVAGDGSTPGRSSTAGSGEGTADTEEKIGGARHRLSL